MNEPLASLRVRRGNASDAAFALDLGLRTIGDSISDVRPAPLELVALSYRKLVDYVFGQSHVLLVAEAAGERLGFLIFMDQLPDEVTSEPQAFVAYMAVEPHARKRGVGRALLAAAETAASDAGLPAIALMVTENNADARSLYASAGFVTERRLLCKPL